MKESAFSGSLQREIGLLLVENANVGDYVFVHAGYAIQKLDEKEPLRTISLLESYLVSKSNSAREEPS